MKGLRNNRIEDTHPWWCKWNFESNSHTLPIRATYGQCICYAMRCGAIVPGKTRRNTTSITAFPKRTIKFCFFLHSICVQFQSRQHERVNKKSVLPRQSVFHPLCHRKHWIIHQFNFMHFWFWIPNAVCFFVAFGIPSINLSVASKNREKKQKKPSTDQSCFKRCCWRGNKPWQFIFAQNETVNRLYVVGDPNGLESSKRM